MSREDIVRMLRWADRASEYENRMPDLSLDYLPFFERFAALVAAEEREACAKVCEERGVSAFDNHDLIYDECAKLIRARGEK